MPADPQAQWTAAFLAASTEFPTIAKSKKAEIPTKGGGKYSYNYADLGAVMDAVRPVLADHGLVISQATHTVDGRIGVETRIYHLAGHVESFGILTLPGGSTGQDAGSAVTYARRYSAVAALGLVTEDDDDGKRATTPEPEPELSKEEILERGINKIKAQLVEEMGTKKAAQEAWASVLDTLGFESDEDITTQAKLNKANKAVKGLLDASEEEG